MDTLSGPLSRRRLGTRSGDLRRMARMTDDRRAKSMLEMSAAEAKMQEGSSISSAESNMAEQRLGLRAQRGLMEARRRAQMGGPGEMDAPSEPLIPAPNTQPTPPLLASQVVQPPQREGRINGLPASQALAGMRGAADAEPGNMADIARRDIPVAGPSAPSLSDRLKFRTQNPAPDNPLARAAAIRRATTEGAAANAPKALIAAPAFDYRSRVTAPNLSAPAPVAAPAVAAAAPPAPSIAPKSMTSPGAIPISARESDSFYRPGNALSAAAARFRKEESKGLKTPLRSALLAAGTGMQTSVKDIARTYR